MEASLKLSNRYAMILDPETIMAVVAHADALSLSRRECHPLDRRHGKCANSVVARYDAEVEAAPLAEEELESIDAAIDAQNIPIAAHADSEDEDF